MGHVHRCGGGDLPLSRGDPGFGGHGPFGPAGRGHRVRGAVRADPDRAVLLHPEGAARGVGRGHRAAGAAGAGTGGQPPDGGSHTTADERGEPPRTRTLTHPERRSSVQARVVVAEATHSLYSTDGPRSRLAWKKSGYLRLGSGGTCYCAEGVPQTPSWGPSKR